MLVLSISDAKKELSRHLRSLRLRRGLTQAGLAKRSGVKLATLRKFEQKGQVSLESFLKLLIVLDRLQPLVDAVEPRKTIFKTMEEVLEEDGSSERKKGWLT